MTVSTGTVTVNCVRETKVSPMNRGQKVGVGICTDFHPCYSA